MEKYPPLILLVSKPFGITSFKFTEKVKRAVGAKKAGHTGTLDPMATGLMVIAINDATRFIPYLNTDTKEYIIQVRFGIETDTGDISGNVLRKSEKIPSLSEIKEKIASFTGEIEQVPPVFSAKKLNGTPLYKLARNGEKVKAKPVKVKIFEMEIKSYEKAALVLRVLCSKGTYMRALARDLGRALGSAATLSAICRTKVGRFSIEDATYISCLKAGKTKGIVPLKDALDFPLLRFNGSESFAMKKAFLNGNKIQLKHISVMDENGNFLGVARIEGGFVKAEKVRPVQSFYSDMDSSDEGSPANGSSDEGPASAAVSSNGGLAVRDLHFRGASIDNGRAAQRDPAAQRGSAARHDSAKEERRGENKK